MSFYMYLPSTGSQRYFPDNSVSKFRIKTPVKLDLSQYKVTLTEITYMYWKKIFTGLNSDNAFKVYKASINDFSEKETKLSHLVEEIN